MEEAMPRPFYAVIIPLGEAPEHERPGHRPDQGLPGGGGYPDQPIYHPGHPDHGLPAYPDQGLPGGEGGGSPDQGFNPDYPDQGLPGGGGRPPRPGHLPSRPGRPGDPGFGWGGGERPGHRPVRPGRPVDPGYGVGENQPDQGLPPELGPPVGPVQPWVPPAGEELPPPPEEIADKVVVAVWRPSEQHWTVATAEGPHPEQNG
jgi:hypothetical protein